MKSVPIGRNLLASPEFNVGIFAFLLNYPWEFLQAPFFEGMADAGHWDSVLFCSRAAVGDVLIALTAFGVVSLASSDRHWVLRSTRRQQVGFILIGLLITVAIERLSTEAWNRWEYAPAMPTLPVLRTGALPLAQWIVLPPLVLWTARRQMIGSDVATTRRP